MTFRALFGATLGVLLFSGQAFATIYAPAHVNSPLTCLRDFYVSTIGADTATCGAGPIGTNTNCATPWGANNASSIGNTGTTLRGGDCVHVQGATATQTNLGSSGWVRYNAGANYITFNRSGNSNSPTGYINYVCTVPHGCDIFWTGNNGSGNGGIITGNFVAFDGFEFDGGNQQGYNGYNESNTNTYNLGGGFFNYQAAGHHHIFFNNIIHSVGGQPLPTVGIGSGSFAGDYEYDIANEVYDTSGTNPCHTSAIDIVVPQQIPGYVPSGTWDNLPNHFQVLMNVIHDVGETAAEPAQSCGGQGTAHTDGECILMDDWGNTGYPYSGLIAFNLVRNCGGNGIQNNQPENVTVINNTVWGACQDPTEGGCGQARPFGDNTNGKTALWENNIFVRTASSSGDNSGTFNTGGFALRIDNGCAPGISHNLLFDLKNGGQSIGDFSATCTGNTATILSNNITATDPKLVNPPHLLLSDFQPQTGSPVLGKGTSTASVTAIVPCNPPDGSAAANPPNIGAFTISNAPGLGPVSINSGGPAVAGVPPQASFIADTAANSGSVVSNNPTGAVDTSLVVNPAPINVYRTERYENPATTPFTYTITGLSPLTVYSVRLHFTEDFNVAGQRVFSVSANGTPVPSIQNFDIYVAAGNAQHKAVVKPFSQAADASGNIAITFQGSVGSAKVDGVEVLNMPTATLQANQTTINQGGNVTLTWNSSNSTRCIGSPASFSTGNAVSGSVQITPSVSTTFNVSCDAGGVAATASQSVTVNTVSATLTADQTTILPGTTTTLRWSSNGTRCIGTGFSTGTGNPPNGSLVVSPTATTTYSVACDSGGTPNTASVTVTVSGVTASITATQSPILNGQTTTLNWSTNGTRCVGTGFSTGNSPNGSLVVSPTTTTTYSVACDNGGTPTTTCVTVTVTPVTASLSASPSVILNGQPSTLTWQSNGTRCVGTGFSTANAPNGTLSVSPTVSTGYSVACDAGGATTPASTTVSVNAVTASLTATKTQIVSGDTSTLNWSSNGTRCVGTNFSTGNAPNGSLVVSPVANTTYSVACDAGGATTPASVTINVNAVTASILSNVTAVPSNAATISWSSTGAAACTGTNFSTGGATSGSVTVTPLVTTTYSVTCDSSPASTVTVIVPHLSCVAGSPPTCNWVN